MKSLIMLAVLFLTGCASLPKFATVEELNYSRTDPIGGTTINAKGIKRDANGLAVEEYSRETRYPSFNQTVRLKGARFEKAEDMTK